MRAPSETIQRIGFCRHCGTRVVCGPRVRAPHLTLMAGHLRRAHPRVLGPNFTPTSALLVAQFRFQSDPSVLPPPAAVECRSDPASRNTA